MQGVCADKFGDLCWLLVLGGNGTIRGLSGHGDHGDSHGKESEQEWLVWADLCVEQDTVQGLE